MSKPVVADFLVEVGTEELPPKALRRLMDSFAEGVVAGLQQNRLVHGDVKAFASPRRLAVFIAGLVLVQEDRQLTQKGPPLKIAFDKDGQPTKAALAFAGKCGVDVSDLDRQVTDAGEWLSYTATETGRRAEDVIPGIVQQSLDALPVPRRMRWGASQAEFVRPVHWLVMLHGKNVVGGSVLGIESGKNSRGHRFHAPQEIALSHPDEYASLLASKGYVIVDFDARRQLIHDGVEKAARAAGGTPLGSDELYDEVTALTEWPVALTGTFDAAFLELPKEVIVATLTGHQRYFPIQDDEGRLLPAFVTVANIESREPLRVQNGNERVIRPRLADAAFFWENDQRIALGERSASLANVVYQKGLGSLADKAQRVAAIAANIAPAFAADTGSLARAAELAKCDLLTGLVAEFPELQGTMGGYYANTSGESAVVCQAISEQYLPRFAGDSLPVSGEGQALALADKLDTLAGVFALGKKPTGKRDPFGLRRAALGIIRIVLEHGIELDMLATIDAAVKLQPVRDVNTEETSRDLYAFFVERLRGYLLDADRDVSADMFAAVRSQQPSSLLDFAERVKAVKLFMGLEAATSLAAANKRTANMLRQADLQPVAANPELLAEAAELALHRAIQEARASVAPLLQSRSYAEALQLLAQLREPVDAFFDDVMVMDEDMAVRNNRLALLAELRSLFLGVADLSRLTPAEE